MSDVLLSDADQVALRYLLAAEPVAGRPLPNPHVLERLAELLRCDAVGAVVTDQDGYVVDQVEIRHGHGAAGCSDSLSVGFRDGQDRVVEVWGDRRTGEFSPRDLAVLTMIAPVVQRLVRDAASPSLSDTWTI